MIINLRTTWLLLVITTTLTGCVFHTGGDFAIHSQTTVEFKLGGYNGFTETSIFEGKVGTNSRKQITTPYRGLAFLSFPGGQRYPVILGDDPFTLNIADASQIPTFTESIENDHLYRKYRKRSPLQIVNRRAPRPRTVRLCEPDDANQRAPGVNPFN